MEQEINLDFNIKTRVNNRIERHRLEFTVMVTREVKSHDATCTCHERGFLIDIQDLQYKITEFSYDDNFFKVTGPMDTVIINALLRYHDINLIEEIIKYINAEKPECWTAL